MTLNLSCNFNYNAKMDFQSWLNIYKESTIIFFSKRKFNWIKETLFSIIKLEVRIKNLVQRKRSFVQKLFVLSYRKVWFSTEIEYTEFRRVHFISKNRTIYSKIIYWIETSKFVISFVIIISFMESGFRIVYKVCWGAFKMMITWKISRA